ncbi:MAG: hypothetical protein ACK5LJ_07015 [Paracoccus sp. (in: a-proteobacteria)]
MSALTDQLELREFLQNTAGLLNAINYDAHQLQLHLAELTAPRAATENAPPFDLIILQSLDRLTQVLSDLSIALALTSQQAPDFTLHNWQETLSELNLKQVREVLTHGENPQGGEPHVELF